MNTSGIYKITNLINHKIYIGSSINIKTRLARHLNDLKSNKHYNKHLQASWNKYEKENFKFEVLKEVKNLELLIRFEQVYINLYKSVDFGYNKRRIADSNKGNKWTKEAKNRLSKSKLGMKGHENQIKSAIGNKFNKGGYKLSENFKQKRKEISLNFWKNIDPLKKKELFNKISIKRKGVKRPNSKISKDCRNSCIKSHQKKINQYTLDGDFIKTWSSIKETSESLKISISIIGNSLRNKKNHNSKFIFTYYDHIKSDKLLENPEEDNQQPIIILNE